MGTLTLQSSADSLLKKLAEPEFQKKLLKFFIIIVVLFVIWRQWGKIKSWFTKVKSDTEVKNEAHDLETKAIASGETASYSDSQYSSYARQIETLMTGNTTNSDKQQIINIVGMMKNNVDWAKLVKAFGVRSFKSAAIALSKTTLDLVGWLNKELNSNEITAINNYFEQIGITARI